MMSATAAAQEPVPPALSVRETTLNAFASEDSLSVWMSPSSDDGVGPYYMFGEGTAVPQVGNMDPQADAAFETVIPLVPGLENDIVLAGTISVQAYIGGGAYTVGRASIGTSLLVNGEAVASADEIVHNMIPSIWVMGAGTQSTYSAIDWTMDIEETLIPAGSTLEWVLSGEVVLGNNIYLAAHEARGRSHIVLPIKAVGPFDVTAEEINVTETETPVANQTTEPESPEQPEQPEAPADPTSEDSPDQPTQGTGNSTGDAPKDEESPGLGLAALVAGLGLAVRRRIRQ